MRATGSSGPARNVRLRRRLRRWLRRQQRRPPGPGGGGETADGRPGNNDATPAGPCALPPPTKPQNDDFRKEFTFTDETGANIGMEIFTCNHCSQVIQTSATLNATRLKTHLSQLCQKCPGESQDPSFQLGPGSKEESKDGPPVVSELHVRIKHMQTKKHGHQCHALQCNRAKKKNKRAETRFETRVDGCKT